MPRKKKLFLSSKYKQIAVLLFLTVSTFVLIFYLKNPTSFFGEAAGPSDTTGFWITPEEISQLPASGPAWDEVKKAADRDPGTANIANQNYDHPINTLAAALVYVKTGAEPYRTKAINELIEVIGTENNTDSDCSYTRPLDQGGPAGARSLAIGRNLLSYVVAADVLNFRSGGYDPNGKGSQFEAWVAAILQRQNCPNNGSGTWPNGDWFNLAQVHNQTVSNGNSIAGASRVAASAYLKDREDIDKAWLTFRQYSGDTSLNVLTGTYNSFSKTWVTVEKPVIGINPKGAQINGFSVDGVLPNDQGRGGSFSIPPRYTQYPWEGLQGAYAQALIFHRLGYDAFNQSDQALKRGVEYQWFLQQQFGGDWWDPGRANWVKHLANIFYGQNYPVSLPDKDRIMAWTTWTHPTASIPRTSSPPSTPTPSPTSEPEPTPTVNNPSPTSEPEPTPKANTPPQFINSSFASARLNRRFNQNITLTDVDQHDSLSMSLSETPPGLALTSCSQRFNNRAKREELTCRLTGRPTKTGVFTINAYGSDSHSNVTRTYYLEVR